MQPQDTHPSDRDLLLAAEGELPAGQLERVREHLAACPDCRARESQLEEAMTGFVRLQRRAFDPLLPPAPSPRASLQARLDELAAAPAAGWRPREAAPRWAILAAAAACILAVLTIVMLTRASAPHRRALSAGFAPVTVPTARLTPGAARSTTRDEVCAGSPDKNRAVPLPLRRRVFEVYGISGADPGAYEVDYLITPALGGADDIRNLWPESYSSTTWNAHVKDALEDRLRDLVCGGELDLGAAQRDIAADWIAAYKKYFHTDKPIVTSR